MFYYEKQKNFDFLLNTSLIFTKMRQKLEKVKRTHLNTLFQDKCYEKRKLINKKIKNLKGAHKFTVFCSHSNLPESCYFGKLPRNPRWPPCLVTNYAKLVSQFHKSLIHLKNGERIKLISLFDPKL